MFLKIRGLFIYILAFASVLTFFLYSAAVSSPIAVIKSVEYPGEKRIYFGPILDKDTSVLNFNFTSYDPTKTLVFYHKHPTYLITSYPDQALTDKDHFDTVSPAIFPFILEKNKLVENLSIKFSTVNVPTSSYGRKEARLVLGLVSPEDTTNNIVSDTFYLIGKKTKLFVDWYDDIVNFDTVLIQREQAVVIELKAKNTNKYSISAIEQKYNLLSKKLNDDEFLVEEKKYPLTFYPGDNLVYKSWKFYYKPLDTFADTAIVSLMFQPEPDKNPNKIDTAKVKLIGTGARHSLQIKDATCNYFSDTIDVGSIRVGETKTVKIKLSNTGNLNYGLISQNIYDEFSDQNINYFQIKTPFLEDNRQLLAGDTASFEITFSPNKKGAFIARYVLENDFSRRKIHSSSKNDYKKTFVLMGTGVMPVLNLPIDTLNFGNVSYANSGASCSTTKDTTIQIYNTGNATLIISNIHTDNSAFVPEHSDLILSANSVSNLNIKFLATYPEKTTVANLLFETNEILSNTSKIILVGTSIPPVEAELRLPDIKNKPGNILEVPVILKNNQNIKLNKYIKTYSFDVSFNSTLLEFINFNKVNTASEGCDVSVTYDTESTESIKIRAGGHYNNFLNNDTLLLLNFKTFIGSNSSTELALQNAKVGNGNCEDFMKLNLVNGRYSIDSICGLSNKLQTGDISKFKFEANASNLTPDINIEFYVPYQINSTIELINFWGEQILKENISPIIGSQHKKINISTLSNGIYFCKFSAGIYNKITPIIILK